MQSRQISCVNSIIVYSCHFIANSTSYVVLLIFEMLFSVPVISRIESIEGGQVVRG